MTGNCSNKGEKGRWGQCRLCSGASKICASKEKHTGFWGGEGEEPAGRQGREQNTTSEFCAYPSGAGSWHTCQQGWTRIRRATWKSSDLLSFLPSKCSFTPWDFILSASCSKLLLCSITWTASEVSCGWFSDIRALLVLQLFLLVKQCFPLPQLRFWGAGTKSIVLRKTSQTENFFGQTYGAWEIVLARVMKASATGLPSPPSSLPSNFSVPWKQRNV